MYLNSKMFARKMFTKFENLNKISKIKILVITKNKSIHTQIVFIQN